MIFKCGRAAKNDSNFSDPCGVVFCIMNVHEIKAARVHEIHFRCKELENILLPKGRHVKETVH